MSPRHLIVAAGIVSLTLALAPNAGAEPCFRDVDVMTMTGAPNFGRGTAKRVNLNAARTFGNTVRLCEMKVVEEFTDISAPPPAGTKSPEPESKE